MSFKAVTIRATLTALAVTLPLSALAMADAPKSVDIPAGDLSTALLELSHEYGADLVYRPEQIHGLRTQGAKGSLTSEQAVMRLLEGTRLHLTVASSGALLITQSGAGSALSREPADVARREAATTAEDSAKGREDSSANRFRVAQAAAASAPSDASLGDQRPVLEEVVVTGSLIKGATPASPVTTVSRQDIDSSGYTDIGSIIRQLPQMFGGGQNVANIGQEGGTLNSPSVSFGSSANLRGLGSDATLTLLDGHRMAADGSRGSVDISQIPLAAVDRVEIVSDGASSLYGADAVGGVVNVILRRRFEGVQANAYLGTSTDGGGFSQTYSVVGGRNWGGGNLVLSGEVGTTQTVRAEDRADIVDLSHNTNTELLPQSQHQSVFGTFNQDIGSQFSVFAEGLYTHRYANGFIDDASVGSRVISHVDQYMVVSGVRATFAEDWTAELSGEAAGGRDQNSQPLYRGAVVSPHYETYDNTTRSVDLTSNGTLLNLPTGAAKLGLGLGYRKERYSDELPATPSSDLFASRNVRYAYGELNVPLVAASDVRMGLNSLDLDVAARTEHYSDFGGTTNPKIGLSYVPTPGLRLRGTWDKSFVAPTLSLVHGVGQTYLYGVPDPLSATGRSIVLFNYGANADLKPQTSRSWTLGFDAQIQQVPGLKVSATYFDIHFSHRVAQPTIELATLLTDPLLASFVTRNPTAAQQAAFIAASPNFTNYTGAAYDTSTVAALFDDNYQNLNVFDSKGVDTSLDYAWTHGADTFDSSFRSTWLHQTLTYISGGDSAEFSGQLSSPPTFKARAGESWTRRQWNVALFVNYLSSERNNAVGGEIPSWTTVDGQLVYRIKEGSLLGGTKMALSVTNLFDRLPPRIASGSSPIPVLRYDTANGSPLGRFVSLSIGKSW